jgi:hypothetical protein
MLIASGPSTADALIFLMVQYRQTWTVQAFQYTTRTIRTRIIDCDDGIHKIRDMVNDICNLMFHLITGDHYSDGQINIHNGQKALSDR